MAWDFSTDPEFQEKLDWVEEFCREEVEPLDYVFPYAVRLKDPKIKALVKGLQDQIKDQGLWAIFLDEDLGGPGYGQLKLGLLNEILGRYGSAPAMFGAAAPDTGNMEMLAAYGTLEQKERWLKPLLNQEMFSAYSMTEPQGGSDPNLFKTHAVRDGDEWVINGEKWFSSGGRVADILFVMCTNGMFVVPRETPGVEIQPEPRNHNHIIYNDVRVPLDHLLGPEDGAKVLAQRRLGGGRIHHAMRTVAQCKLAFDMMCERALSRESHGKIIAEHQMVQEKIADSYAAPSACCACSSWRRPGRSTTAAPRTPAPTSPPSSTRWPRCCARCPSTRCISSARSGPRTSRPFRRCTRRRRPWASPTASTKSIRPRWLATS